MPDPGQLYRPSQPMPLLEFLLEALKPMKRTRVKDLLRFGNICVNSQVIRQFDHPLQLGDEVSVGRSQPSAGPPIRGLAGIRILFEDSAIIVIDKPAGLLTVGTEGQKTTTVHHSVNQLLQKRSPRSPERAYIVHRLDRETSGALVLAKSPEMQRKLQSNWGEAEKWYLAIVEGVPPEPEGILRSYLSENRALKVVSGPPEDGAKLAITHYRNLKTVGSYTLVEVRLETGRKHQIRVQFADRGTPVVGDPKYGSRTDPLQRMGLHAERLVLPHPLTGKRMQFYAELPAVFMKLVPIRRTFPNE